MTNSSNFDKIQLFKNVPFNTFYYINGNGQWTQFPTSSGGGGTEPLKYKALLTQTGTNDPVATILENTLGGEIVWARLITGIYEATLTGAFTLNKTVIFIGSVYDNNNGTTNGRQVIPSDDLALNSFRLETYNTSNALTDSRMFNTPITIEVYP